MKSRAAILTAPGEPLVIDEIDVPDPGPEQVVVKQTATGICGSQIHEQIKTPEEKCPRVLGHEGVGVVTHAGRNVTHLKEGDFAITTWVPRAGYPGRDFVDGLVPVGTTFRGKPIGGAIGTFTEYCLASDQLAVRIAPEHASPECSIIGCAVLTGAGAVLHTAGVRAEESVVVVGAGGIGLSALKMASLLQAYPIIAVDLADEKLELAKQWGATHAIDASRVDPVEAVWRIVPRGADYAFDAVGTVSTHESILEMVRGGGPGAHNVGGMAVLIGWPQTEFKLNAEHFVFHQRQYRGSHGSSIPDKDFPMYLRLAGEGKFPVDELVTRSYAIEEINDALDDLREGRILGRSIIRF